jgi:hypothetical protein
MERAGRITKKSCKQLLFIFYPTYFFRLLGRTKSNPPHGMEKLAYLEAVGCVSTLGKIN